MDFTNGFGAARHHSTHAVRGLTRVPTDKVDDTAERAKVDAFLAAKRAQGKHKPRKGKPSNVRVDKPGDRAMERLKLDGKYDADMREYAAIIAQYSRGK